MMLTCWHATICRTEKKNNFYRIPAQKHSGSRGEIFDTSRKTGALGLGMRDLLDTLQNMKQEQLAGLSFVLLLHGAVLYGLWSYRIIPTPIETYIMVSNLIDPPARPPKPPQPKPPQPKPPKPHLSEPPPEHLQLAVEVPVVLPDEPVSFTPPPPVVEAPPMPSQPVVLASELSVSCPVREPPYYPAQSVRLNEQGRVVLRVEMGEDGRVSSAEVKTPSGFPRLDAAAVSAVKTWRCKPVIRNGVAVPAVALQPFVFVLEGR